MKHASSLEHGHYIDLEGVFLANRRQSVRLIAGTDKRRGFPGAEKLAGAAGIEPANAGTKNRCLTAWRRPN